MTNNEAIKYLKQLYPNGGHCWLDEQRIEAIDMAISAIEFKEKVRAEIERRKETLKPCGGQGLVVTRLMRELCDDFLSFIDSMQEEEIPPKFPIISQKKCMYTKDDFTDEDRKVLCNGCEEDCEYAQKKEPANKDYENALNSVAVNFMEAQGITPNLYAEQIIRAVKHGAKWQKEQFEKNRLAHCDAQTEKEAQIEQDFVTGIIDKEYRQPTFDDAIKYGIRLKEQQMMANAVEGVVHHFEKCKVASVHYNDPTGVPMAYFTSPEGLSAGDKVKIIVIKDD